MSREQTPTHSTRTRVSDSRFRPSVALTRGDIEVITLVSSFRVWLQQGLIRG